MNNQIISSLYEFWEFIGNKTNKLIENKNYKSINPKNSDWPKRIFSVSNKQKNINEIINLSQKKIISNILTIPKPNKLNNNPNLKFIFKQTNMALQLNNIKITLSEEDKIKKVKTMDDSFKFANTASKAFNYKVSGEIIYIISKNIDKIKIYNYIDNNKCYACGIIYFDSYNNAGLHMIGTIPEVRGKGIGNTITKKLLLEGINNNCKYSVLNASAAGEKIYKKLGFISYGEIETYQILDKE
jgi:GNAT superfamily N-acetyltransferase